MTESEFEGTTLKGSTRDVIRDETEPAAIAARRSAVSVETRAAAPARARTVPGRARPAEAPATDESDRREATRTSDRDGLKIEQATARPLDMVGGLPRERRFRGAAEILGFAGISVYLIGAILWEGAYSLFRLGLFVVTRGTAKKMLKKVMVRNENVSSVGGSTVGRSAATLGLLIALLVISPGCKHMSGKWAAQELGCAWEETAWSVSAMVGSPKQYGKDLAGLWEDLKTISDPEWGQREQTFFMSGVK